MGKFAKLMKGLDEVRPVELELPGAEGARSVVRLGLRPLAGWDETAALEDAAKFAKARGASSSAEDPIYVMAVWAETLFRAAISLDAEDKGAPFFDSSEEILRGLDRDRISLLYEQQQIVQEGAGARKETMNEAEMVAFVMRIAHAEVDEVHRFFSGWGPTARATLLRFLARQLLDSLSGSSPSGPA